MIVSAFFLFKKIFFCIFVQLLKTTFHLQLQQNIGQVTFHL